MNFLDLFAGIGGFRFGMERAGHKCVGYCEIDKYARSSYHAIHNTEGEIDFKDITEVTDEQFRELRGKVDVICGGFPCQAFSVAGKQLGFEDARGTLFFEIARAAKEIKPRYIFLENVRNLLSHDKGKTFERMLKILDELGYDVEWQVLNSKNFGVPQNRERVFIVGHLRGERTSRIFPITRGAARVSNGSSIDKVYKVREAVKKGYSLAGIGDSINFSHPNSKTRRGRVGKNIANTLLTSDEQGVVLSDYKIRKLTPRECWRLQGFPDWAFDKAQEVNSNSQLYKQAGNSVTVNVIEEIAKRF